MHYDISMEASIPTAGEDFADIPDRRGTSRFPLREAIKYTVLHSRTQKTSGTGKTLNFGSRGILFHRRAVAAGQRCRALGELAGAARRHVSFAVRRHRSRGPVGSQESRGPPRPLRVQNPPRLRCRRRGRLAQSLSGAFFTMKRAAAGARIGSAQLGRTAGETGTPAWRGKPTVDKIVDGRSLRKPQNAPICHRCARRAKSKHCK